MLLTLCVMEFSTLFWLAMFSLVAIAILAVETHAYTKVTNMATVILAVETHAYTKVTNVAIVILAVETHTQRSQIWQH